MNFYEKELAVKATLKALSLDHVDLHFWNGDEPQFMILEKNLPDDVGKKIFEVYNSVFEN